MALRGGRADNSSIVERYRNGIHHRPDLNHAVSKRDGGGGGKSTVVNVLLRPVLGDCAGLWEQCEVCTP